MPYLRPLAELSAEVDRAAAEIEIPEAPVPTGMTYRSDFLAGVTLLQSADAAVDLDPGGRTAAALIERLAPARSSGGSRRRPALSMRSLVPRPSRGAPHCRSSAAGARALRRPSPG
jgi:hypothetical protein